MKILLPISLFAALLLAGCGGSAQNAANTAPANAGNSENPLETKKAASDPTTNNAPNLTPVVKAYCDAWTKNDEAALRKVYSSDTIKYFEDDMKAEKIKSLMKYLEDDRVSGTPCEARNEQINGDSAVAEFKADKYPNGIKILFVKEGGEWKMTNKSPDIPAQSKTAGTEKPANAANTSK